MRLSTTSVTVLAVVLSVVGASGSVAPAAPVSVPSLQLDQVSALTNATAMAVRGGDATLYVAQQLGTVRAIRGRRTVARPVVDLTDRVSQDGGERGLLGLTFSPEGDRLYVDYTDRAGNTQIDELTMRRRVADPTTRRTVLTVDQPQPNHNGGQLAFGPDGYLYIGLGDGGGAGDSGSGHAAGGNGQSLHTLLGKILRIDPHAAGAAPYTIPADNPFVGDPQARPEIWAYGLRNPWRFSFDTATGDLWIGDVGQNAWEEIDHVAADTSKRNAGRAANFGWNRLEGTHTYRGSPVEDVEPVYEISHDTGACAVIGGFVYHGRAIPGLDGQYLFSDACDGTIRVLVADPSATGKVIMRSTTATSSQVSSFGRDDAGRLYVLSLDQGIFRLDAASS
jgi:glucose/arabinose dehydrogenase